NPMNKFNEALTQSARAQEIPEAHDVYGWLVGSWNLDVLRYGVDMRDQKIRGEVHFARTLEGRAVQDVWIMPSRQDRAAIAEGASNMYGTTVRVWDPKLDAWRITWINGVTGSRDELVGRWNGRDIVQVGAHADGTPIRWCFTEITNDSFRWTGE